jgi:hypothetical protein
MLEAVDPDLELTYPDPALERPTPQVCHGRHELEQLLRSWSSMACGPSSTRRPAATRVMVGVRTLG